MTVNATTDSTKGELKIKISGNFDFSINQDFRKITKQISASIRTIIVDLGSTDYVDSSALGMLLVLREKVGDNKQSIRVINAKPEVAKILAIANFDKLFTLT